MLGPADRVDLCLKNEGWLAEAPCDTVWEGADDSEGPAGADDEDGIGKEDVDETLLPD